MSQGRGPPTYRDGAGLSLICLHGGMGVDSASLRIPGIFNLARCGCEVVIFDPRGHGNSSKIALENCTQELWATDVFYVVSPLFWLKAIHSAGPFLRWIHRFGICGSLAHKPCAVLSWSRLQPHPSQHRLEPAQATRKYPSSSRNVDRTCSLA
jgi:pimeloyl-ACP methyl ester carboxylesterase